MVPINNPSRSFRLMATFLIALLSYGQSLAAESTQVCELVSKLFWPVNEGSPSPPGTQPQENFPWMWSDATISVWPDTITHGKPGDRLYDVQEIHRAGKSALIDVDNDGKLDRVTILSNGSHYQNGATMYVEFGQSATEFQPKDANLEAGWYLPCQLDQEPLAVSDCAPFSNKGDEAGPTVALSNGRSIHFRSRYAAVAPFRYQNSTYVIVGNSVGTLKQSFAVIKPLPGKRFHVVCAAVSQHSFYGAKRGAGRP